jgi:phosphoglycerate kinase
MKSDTGILSLNDLKPADLQGKTIFIRADFNVPLCPGQKGYYQVADDTRIRRFLDLTFRKIHELTEGNCRIIIGSHLGRPHKKKDHVGWDGIFNIQFVSSHFDTLIRKTYGDTYTIFPPEIIDSHLKHSLEILFHCRLPYGGIKFLPNLRYMLEPRNPETYRKEFIEELAGIADVYINCAFGCSHRVTKSIKLLPQLMRQQGKLVVGGLLLNEEIQALGDFAARVLAHPKKTAIIAGGSKIADKIHILKQFVVSNVRLIFIGGKMVNAFLIAQQQKQRAGAVDLKDICLKLVSQDEDKNRELLAEIKMAEEILDLAQHKDVKVIFPDDYKVVSNYQDPSYSVKEHPDFNCELQLDLGPKTIENYSKTILQEGIETVFWNGPLGAYDHPTSSYFSEGSLELAKLLFAEALGNRKFSVVIGGGDSAAILNKVSINELKNLIKKKIEKHFPKTIRTHLLTIGFLDDDSYILWNYLAMNFFVSTGGGAALEFLENYLKDSGQSATACYLTGTQVLIEAAETPVAEEKPVST